MAQIAPWDVGFDFPEFTVNKARQVQAQLDEPAATMTPGRIPDEIGGGERDRFGRVPLHHVTWPGGQGPVLYAEMLAATVDVQPSGNESGGTARAISIYGEGARDQFRADFHGAGPWVHDMSGREVDDRFYRDAQGFYYALKTPSGAAAPAILQDILDYLVIGRQP